MALKLLVRVKKCGTATNTNVVSFLKVIPIHTGERALGSGLSRHSKLLWRQSLSPLAVGHFGFARFVLFVSHRTSQARPQ